MRVLLFHPVRLPSLKYGGIERVVIWLAKGLKERGHEVSIAALEGSVLPEGVSLFAMKEGSVSAHELLKRKLELDVIHFMATPEKGVIEQLSAASLVTIHGNGTREEFFYSNTVFLSRDHARRHGRSAFVYNGVEVSPYVNAQFTRQNHFLFLSKTSWKVKNVRGAIAMCEEAQVQLKVAGGARPWDARLRVALHSVVKPHMEWIGEVDDHAKIKLMSEAKAFLFPVLWSEPFGLVVVEALLCGAPVLASRMGSLPELVPEDVGMLFDSKQHDEWIEVLKNFPSRLQNKRAREWAVTQFSHLKMAENYEKVYEKILNKEELT